MRVFLDDERATPDGWIRVYWPSEAIALLETGQVEELSLDHDLGDDERGTGYDVVLWIEEAVVLRGFKPPKMAVHSANSSAREKMLAGIRSIERHALATMRNQPLVLASAGSTLPAALAALRGSGFVVAPAGDGRLCKAEKGNLTLVAEDPLLLLGLAKLHEMRGSDWAATDTEFEDYAAFDATLAVAESAAEHQTAKHLLDVQQELAAREPIFHRPEHDTTRADFEAMTAEDFWEVGASGRRYSREHVLDTLVRRNAQPHEDEWQTDDFYCQQVAPANYLLTYTLRQGSRVTRRATLWRRESHGWVIVYHQGTIVEAT